MHRAIDAAKCFKCTRELLQWLSAPVSAGQKLRKPLSLCKQFWIKRKKQKQKPKGSPSIYLFRESVCVWYRSMCTCVSLFVDILTNACTHRRHRMMSCVSLATLNLLSIRQALIQVDKLASKPLEPTLHCLTHLYSSRYVLPCLTFTWVWSSIPRFWYLNSQNFSDWTISAVSPAFWHHETGSPT